MSKDSLQIFEGKNVRTAWNEQQEKWYFSIVDVIEVLTGTDRPRKYWADLKKKLLQEGSEMSEKIGRLKLLAIDGKRRLTDVADMEQMFRIIQSIPSPKAEPFKLWMAQVAALRIDQIIDPELSINQAIDDYRRKGYDERWINQRIKSIEIRKKLTDEWKRGGISDDKYGWLTNILTKGWSGKKVKEYKAYKGLKNENLRDNMTDMELVLNTLAEVTATEISKSENPKGDMANAKVAKRSGDIAKSARLQIEKETGKPIVSPLNAKDIKSLE